MRLTQPWIMFEEVSSSQQAMESELIKSRVGNESIDLLMTRQPIQSPKPLRNGRTRQLIYDPE